MAALAERERPTTLADMAGQREAVESIRRVIGDGTAGGRAWFISGASGCGKTTLARILASGVASPHAVEESNGADLTLDDIRRMEREFRCRALAPDGMPTGRAWIINEAHLIRGASLSRFLTTLEPDDGGLPDYVVVIFTTTSVGVATMFGDHEDASPLVSRCVEVRLDNGPESQRERALWVRAKAVAAGCDGYPPEAYVDAMREVKGNTRMLAQRVEAGQLAKTAAREMAVPAAAKKAVKLGELPPQAELAKLCEAELVQMCGERGVWLPNGTSKASMVRLLLKSVGLAK